MLRLILSFSIIILAIPSFSKDKVKAPKQEKILGLIIYVKKDLSKKQIKQLNQFNTKLGFKVVSKGSKLNFWVLESDKAGKLNYKIVKEVCRKYEKKPYIKSCHADSEVQPYQETTLAPSISVVADSKVEPRCKLFKDSPQVGYEGRSDFWAQEAVGADLIEEDSSKELAKNGPPVYVCDSKQDNHDIDVHNVLRGGDKALKPKVENCTRKSLTLEVIDKIKKEHKNKLVIVNYSMGPNNGGYEWKQKDFLPNKDEMKNIVWMQAAGNEFADREGLARAVRDRKDKATIVTSINPYGLPSSFANEGREINVSAPSDNSITACGVDKKHCRVFGGASGATPLVSKAKHKAASYLPGITKEQLKKLLEKTTTRMPQSYERPQKNGKGMLNAYKMVEVAKKINSQCKSQDNRDACVKSKLENRNSYVFKNKLDKKSLEKKFPSCFGGGQELGCDAQKENFKELRKAALLNPDNKELQNTIACVQQQQGHYVSAQFYKNINRNFNAKPFERWELGINDISDDFLRAMPYMKNPSKDMGELPFPKDRDKLHNTFEVAKAVGPRGLEVFKRGLSDPNRQTQELAVNYLSETGRKGLPLLKKAANHPSATVRSESVYRLVRDYGARSFTQPIINKALKDRDEKVRQRTIDAVGTLRKPSKTYFDTAIKDPSSNVRISALRSAGVLGDAAGKYYNQGLSDKSERVRIGAAEAMNFDVPEGKALFRKATNDPSMEVRAIAYTQAEFHPSVMTLDDAKTAMTYKTRPEIRAAGVRVARRYGKQGLPYIVRGSKDDHLDVRHAAMSTMWDLHQRKLVSDKQVKDIANRLYHDPKSDRDLKTEAMRLMMHVLDNPNGQ